MVKRAQHGQRGSRFVFISSYDPNPTGQVTQLLSRSGVVPELPLTRLTVCDDVGVRSWVDIDPIEQQFRALSGLMGVLSNVEREVLIAAMHTNYEAKRGVVRLKRRLRQEHDITPDRFNEILKSAFRRLGKAQQRRQQN